MLLTDAGQTLAYTSLGGSLEATAGYGYFFQNDLRTLDVFGEWYYDTENKMMYVYFGDKNPVDYTVNVPTLEELIYNYRKYYKTIENITFTGSARSTIHLWSFANLDTFRNCDFMFAGEHHLKLLVARNVCVENCTFKYSVKSAVFSDSSRDPLFRNNHISHSCTLPGAAIGSRPERAALTSINTTVSYTEGGYGGDGTVIFNNIIDSCGHVGMRITNTDPDVPVVVRNNLISNIGLLYNDNRR